MDNPELNAMLAQQMQGNQAQAQQAPAQAPADKLTAEQLLAQEQSLDPQLQGTVPTGNAGTKIPEEVLTEKLPQQNKAEAEGDAIPKATQQKETKKAPPIDDMVLVGLLGESEEEREVVKSPLKNVDVEHITRIMMQGDNSDGVFTPTKSSILEETKLKKLHEAIAEKAKIKKSGEAKTTGKYETQFKEDIIKNPQNYKLNTPRGEMSLQDCVKNGYDPETNTFGETPKQMLERHIKNLPAQEQETIRHMVSTESLGLKPEDVNARGIAVSPEMLRQTDMQQGIAQTEPTQSEPQAPSTNVLSEGGIS